MRDITSTMWQGRTEENAVFKETYGEKKSHKIVGKGTSPVLEYDKVVIRTALDYLQQNHDKPQCILVGTYAPHFTYVAPPKWFDYYYDKDILPHKDLYRIPETQHQEQPASEDHVRSVRAAYMGMISNIDEQIGMVHQAWKKYLERTDRKGVFAYISDHGDQNGDRDLYGKRSFFEKSARIPFVLEGDGIPQNKEIHSAASIMDLAPTLCEIAGAISLPDQDGKSLVEDFTSDTNNDRIITTQSIAILEKDNPIGVMFKQNHWKYIQYLPSNGSEVLFNLKDDPEETTNVLGENPEFVKQCKEMIENSCDCNMLFLKQAQHKAEYNILFKYGNVTQQKLEDYWYTPEEFTNPDIVEQVTHADE